MITGKEFFKRVLAEMKDEEALEYAEKHFEKLNKTSSENEPYKAAILGYLRENAGSHTQMDIAEAVGITSNKAGALARQMVEEGTLAVDDIKIPKVGKGKAYSLVSELAVDEDEEGEN